MAFGSFNGNLVGTWGEDAATSSTFSGTVSTSVLTLTTNAAGPMWEGEVLGCVTYSASTCALGPLTGTYITGLHAGSPAGWGLTGSTYDLANASGITISSAAPIKNLVYWPGSSPPLWTGTGNDIQSFDGTHNGAGIAGGRRLMHRMAAMIWGGNGGNFSDPQIDRVKADAAGCDAAALTEAKPCL